MGLNKEILKRIYLVLSNLIILTEAYRPVVLIHGILSDAPSMELIKSEIQMAHPGTIVYIINRYNYYHSLDRAWWQVQDFANDIKKACERHPDGINVLGYSQGGLLGRVVLQYFPEHCVKTFVSLSSPQAGQFGDNFLHLIFPSLFAREAYEIFYSFVGQKMSVGNYWKDPNEIEKYLNFSNFLPYVNNEIISANSTNFKKGILKLEKLVLIGGPDDGVITPWQSAHFEFFDQQKNVTPLDESDFYKNDSIGIKELNDKGKLKIVTVPNVDHIAWHTNGEVIRESVVPHLD